MPISIPAPQRTETERKLSLTAVKAGKLTDCEISLKQAFDKYWQLRLDNVDYVPASMPNKEEAGWGWKIPGLAQGVYCKISLLDSF